MLMLSSDHWVGMLAPESCRNFLVYLTAWLTTTAWQAIAVSTGYITATLLQGIVVLAQPSYVPEPWHTVLILWAAMLFAVIMNSTTSQALARFEGLILVLHLAGFFGVLVPLVYFAPHNDAQTVFTSFINAGGWSPQALSFLIGFPTVATSLVGADCAVHMSEEIQSAALVVPRALMFTIFLNGLFAFGMIIGLMFCLTDLESALGAATTMFYPFLQIFYSAVGSTTGACLMAGVILVLAVASSVSVYASASRMLWSFSRDKGLPFHRQLVKVRVTPCHVLSVLSFAYNQQLSRNSLPVVAIVTTLVITMLLSLIALGSAVALSALLSLIISALYSSYLLVCCLLLWCRITGKIQSHISGSDVTELGFLTWGVWRIPEPLGTMNNIFAILYTVFLLFWSFWPQTNPTTPETANWSILVFGSVVIFSIFWYIVRARHHFKGPIKEA
jgi:amino acid transporter